MGSSREVEEIAEEKATQLPIAEGWVEEKGGEDIKVEMEKEETEPRIRYANRKQILLREVDVESLVCEDHEVRAIWELVGRVDLRRYYEGIKSVEGVAGCPATDPRVMISIWIYSYSKGNSSAREISRLCEYDPAYQWLTGMERINYHSLSDFRVEHKEGLEELFIEVLGVLSGEGLVSLERVMQDGTKVKAYCSSDTFRRENTIKEHLEMAREQVRLMEEESEEEISGRVAKARERAIREKKGKLELAMNELEKIKEGKKNKQQKENARVSMSDPEARIMKQSDGGYAPGYNLQIETESKNKIIVGAKLTQSRSDYVELAGGAETVEKNMGEAPKQVVVDGGFVSRENIVKMSEKGIDLIGPMPDVQSKSIMQLERRGVEAEFYPDKFRYDEASDTMTCPAGKILKYEGTEEIPGRTNYSYRADAIDCEGCPFKNKCCPQNNGKGRAIVRSVDHPAVTAFVEKMKTEEAKAIYKQRGEVAEFPNAWIKSKIGLRQFRLRGLVKAGIEALWACVTYNIQQWIRLYWRPKIAKVVMQNQTSG
jgi:transposase